jgi:hypothetical protein
VAGLSGCRRLYICRVRADRMTATFARGSEDGYASLTSFFSDIEPVRRAFETTTHTECSAKGCGQRMWSES